MVASIDDQRVVEKQLGRTLAFSFSIKVSCPYGRPVVIENQPYSPDEKPNPNIYYLTCPFLRKIISRWEDAGLITDLEETVAASPGLETSLKKAQGLHQREWSRAAAIVAGSEKILATIAPPNIASAKDELKIKCLHAHYAWYLIHPDYQLGRLLAKKINPSWCDDERCMRTGG